MAKTSKKSLESNAVVWPTPITVTFTLKEHGQRAQSSRPYGSVMAAAVELANKALRIAWFAENANEEEAVQQRQLIERASEALASDPNVKLRRQEAALVAVHAVLNGNHPTKFEPPELLTLCLAIDLALNPHMADCFRKHSKVQTEAARKVSEKWGKPGKKGYWDALNALFKFWKLEAGEERKGGNKHGGKTLPLASIWSDLQKDQNKFKLESILNELGHCKKVTRELVPKARKSKINV